MLYICKEVQRESKSWECEMNREMLSNTCFVNSEFIKFLMFRVLTIAANVWQQRIYE